MQDFIINYLGGLGTSLAIFGVLYYVVWVLAGNKLQHRKIQLSKRAGWTQIKEETLHSSLALLGSTVFTLMVLSLKAQGLTKFYAETGKYGMWYEVFTVVVMLFVGDAWFYWLHRGMHHPKVYKYVHALHHRSLDVNPFTSNSFHIVESLALTVWVLPLVLVMPVSLTSLGVMQALGTFNNLKSHLGYELYPKFFTIPPFNMLVTATNHSLHHTQYNGNYGLFFRFWDILCDTELNTTVSTFEDIHKRTNEVVTDNTKYRTLTIDKLVRETNNVVSVYFKPADTAFYNYFAGQYLTVKVKVNGKVYDRCFSLSSSPHLDDFLRITVKLKGEVSHYFFNDAKTGDTIEALLPVGDFYVKPSSSAASNYVMIAGGSGITPLYSMIRQVLHYEPQSTVTLLYTNKSAENIIFKNELNALAESHSQFRYVDFISEKQRISEEDLSKYADSEFYICGPDALKEGMIKHLKQLNVPKLNIHIEHYADGYVPWFGLW